MTTPKQMHDTVAAALALLTTDEADAIIGKPGPGYAELVKALQAESGMLFGAFTGTYGLRKNKASQKTMAQAMAVFAQLLHFAYALGKREGRRENDPTERGE